MSELRKTRAAGTFSHLSRFLSLPSYTKKFGSSYAFHTGTEEQTASVLKILSENYPTMRAFLLARRWQGGARVPGDGYSVDADEALCAEIAAAAAEPPPVPKNPCRVIVVVANNARVSHLTHAYSQYVQKIPFKAERQVLFRVLEARTTTDHDHAADDYLWDYENIAFHAMSELIQACHAHVAESTSRLAFNTKRAEEQAKTYQATIEQLRKELDIDGLAYAELAKNANRAFRENRRLLKAFKEVVIIAKQRDAFVQAKRVARSFLQRLAGKL
jgi:hypothetical protein